MSCTVVCSMFLVLCPSLGSVTIASGQGQITNVKTLENGDYDLLCPSVEERERARNEIHQIANLVISSICNGTPGWRRVAFINMTDTSYDCPTGLNLTSHSKRTCGRSHITHGGCSSTTFSVGCSPYSQVCGRIRGYQFGTTGAFGHDLRDIDSYYVDGVSLTHGGAGRRQHIWTFAAGGSEVSVHPNYGCPCDSAPPSIVPSFVGNDYFCESGLHSEWNNDYFGALFPDDVLWDGQNCTSTSTCCQFNNPPWFTKTLPTNTRDDIELRICTTGTPAGDDVPFELVELYVQ